MTHDPSKGACEINSAPAGFDPPAPVGRVGLTQAQKTALVLIFFAGEMSRSRQFFIAEGSAPVLGSTVDCLHRKGLVKLGVERRKRPDFGKIIQYRYYVSLTDRGEWYATTLIQQRGQMIAALSPEIDANDFEASPNVYPEEQEAEIL